MTDRPAKTDRNPVKQPSSDKDREKLHGRSFQINENSVEKGDPIHEHGPRQRRSGDPQKAEEVEGIAFQVNEDSVKNEDSIKN